MAWLVDYAWTTLRNPALGFERDVTSWLDHLSADASASISAVFKDAVE